MDQHRTPKKLLLLLGQAALVFAVASWFIGGAYSRRNWRSTVETHLPGQLAATTQSWIHNESSNGSARVDCSYAQADHLNNSANTPSYLAEDPIDRVVQGETGRLQCSTGMAQQRVDLPCLVEQQNRMEALRKEFAQNLPLQDPEALWQRMNKGKGRGIVMPAGSINQLANAFTNLKALREVLGCTLPVEIWHLPHENATIATVEPLFKELIDNVSFKNIAEVPIPEHFNANWLDGAGPSKEQGYASKVFAIFSTTFEEVIYMDSDSAPMQDVTRLFSEPAYQDAGNLFWPDYLMNDGAPLQLLLREEAYALHHLLPPWVLSPDFRQSESGQMVLDRRRLADVLHWLWFLNSWHEVQYPYGLADKDTYRLAFALSGRIDDYRQIEGGPGVAFNALQEDCIDQMKQRFNLSSHEPVYLSTGNIQYDSSGRAFFNHRSSASKFDPEMNMFNPTRFISVKLNQCQQWIVKWLNTGVQPTELVRNQTGDRYYYWSSAQEVRELPAGLDQAQLDAAADELASGLDPRIPVQRVEDVAGAEAVFEAQYSAFALFQEKRGYAAPHRIQ